MQSQVRAFVNSSAASVEYAGPAPGLLPGIMQVNLRLPLLTRSDQAFITLSVETTSGVETTQEDVFVYIR